MEALLKAIGNLPKWFTLIILACVSAMLLLATYSIGRTILYDCGSINVAGTKFGGHCVITSFISTTVWDRIDLGAASNGERTDGGSRSECASIINRSSLRTENDPNRRGYDEASDIYWVKRSYGDGLYDVLMQCQDDAIQVIVTSNASWPVESFLDETVAALKSSADSR